MWFQVVVTLVELSVNGSMMGTVEVRLPEEGIGGLVCLKFWDLDSDNKRFSVSTLIYEPHRCVHDYFSKKIKYLEKFCPCYIFSSSFAYIM